MNFKLEVNSMYQKIGQCTYGMADRSNQGLKYLSQRSARHGRPKAGRGAERAKRAERVQSAFTKNRLKKYVPHKGPTEKKICPSLIFLIPHTRTT